VSDDTELNATEPPAPTEAPVAAAPVTSSSDFLSTGAGKAVLIVGAVLVLLVIAGVVGWFVMGPALLGAPGTPEAPSVIVSSPGTPSTPTSPSIVATLPVADVTSRDVFTPPNPFTVIKVSVIPTSGASASNNDDNNGSDVDPDDVILTDIVTENGVRKAVIAYGGNTYTLGAGDLIPGSTDWKVVTVNANSAVLLFGDVSVTLTPGQGASK